MHYLREAGLDVRALVRRPTPWVADATVIELRSPALEAAFEDTDAVVHLAGRNEVESKADPDGSRADTVAIAGHVAAAATSAGVRRLVCASTVHVYGGAIADRAVLTEDTPAAPTGAYAESRYEAEQLCTSTARDVVVLRLTNAVGAPAHPAVDRWTLVANDLCRQAVTTGEVRLRTHGMQWRDFVPLHDVLRAIDDATDVERVGHGIYNVGAGRSTTVRALAGMVQDAAEELTDRRPVLIAPDAPSSPPEAYAVAVDRLIAEGWKPAGPLRPALDETIAFCLANRDAL